MVASRARRPTSTLDRIEEPPCGLSGPRFVRVALICGGGTRQGLWSDALAQIVSLPRLAVASFRLKALPGPSKMRLPLFLNFGELAPRTYELRQRRSDADKVPVREYYQN